MKVHVCSVAFRHEAVTAAGLAGYVGWHGFDGLEIWAPHARDLREAWRALPRVPQVPMLAGYLPLGTPAFDADEAGTLVDLTAAWRAPCLRLFAGATGTDRTAPEARRAILSDLGRVADLAHARGLRIAVETHPGTLADSPEAALDLLAALDHPALGLNFDVLHVWEAGTDPVAGLARLQPHVLHLHLKSVSARDRLAVFEPGNVHDPKGDRRGMCPLFGGALDYDRILRAIPPGASGSLEWFGPDPARVMAEDLRRIRHPAARAA